MQIGKVIVCSPIELLINKLIKSGFVIIESRLNDYHFNELYFKLKGKHTEEIDNISIDKISRFNDNTFICSCHWTTVELVYDD